MMKSAPAREQFQHSSAIYEESFWGDLNGRTGEAWRKLIRDAFLGGISTRQVGRVVAIVTGEAVIAQTVSKLTGDLDEAVQQFHQARLTDDWAYLLLAGVNLKVRLKVAVNACKC